MPLEKIRFIDLCCGIGGFRVGIEQFAKDPAYQSKYEFECVFSADIKLDAIRIYNRNFRADMIPTDIYTMDVATIPEFDLLCCGFPCQPFSSAGNQQGFEDSRGGMIFRIVDICKYHRPSTLILENVSNLLNLENGRCIRRIQDMLTQIGYHVSYGKLNGVEFGVPQSRERVFIIGSLHRLIDLSGLRPNTDTVPPILRDILDHDARYTDIDRIFADRLSILHRQRPIFGHKIQDKWGGDINIHSWDIDYNGQLIDEEKELLNKLMLERRKKHWAVKKNIAWMDGMPLTEGEIRSFYPHPRLHSMLRHLVELGYLKSEKCKDLVNGKRVYEQDSATGYNICKGKLSFPVSRVLDPDGVSPTLTATDSHKLIVLLDEEDGIHGIHIRRLTALELKRVCGYPDEFRTDETVNLYDLFGNTVLPPIVREIVRMIYQ